MRRAARPATVVMGAKLVRVRGTDTDLQHKPGLSAHSRDKDRRWGKGRRGILRPGHQKMEHSLRRKCRQLCSEFLHISRDSEARRAVGSRCPLCPVHGSLPFTAWRNSWWSWWSRERLFGKSSKFDDSCYTGTSASGRRPTRTRRVAHGGHKLFPFT